MIRTRCPACLTVFRVRPEQLQARSGRVRCGHCFRPFDAQAHALAEESAPADDSTDQATAPLPDAPQTAPAPELAAPPTAQTDEPETAHPPAPEAEAVAAPAAEELDSLLEFTIPESFRPERPDSSVTDESAGPAPGPEHDLHSSGENQGDPFPQRRMRPGEEQLPSFEERLAALSLPGRDDAQSDAAEPDKHTEQGEAGAAPHDWRPLPTRFDDDEDLPLVVPAAIRRRRPQPHAEHSEPAPAPSPTLDGASATTTPDDNAADDEARLELPEAWRRPTTEGVERSTQPDEASADEQTDTTPAAAWPPPPAKGGRGAWGLGIGILLGVLAIQATYVLREPIARHWPQTRPTLELACEHVGCTVPYPQHAGEILIDHSHLEMVHADTRIYVLEARVRNRAAYPQAYPHLEVTLTDVRDRPLARRVLEPDEWLPDSGAADERAFEARGDVHLMLPFAAPEVEEASGYRLYAFYP